ncbi:MAG: exodeoxyribonuclease III [Microcoleus sp. PH2017_10_PVI_O_A]|uniref:exodeoxyribonuclease III n=1 Tax=unclassified Microcoleus TaxID=2642155 RepID=UPI001D829A57|nr:MULTISPECIES: exodeoxyribonuclease III [unclassified Microcoleus]TAE76972.1 MAG: exodeoxyribonuclease III [Oscillatoriales cyanobacterium]MCC3406549.1 exodeoxyribonuclease III [Microcoleus sp. PH2017_10_PVI_O_A]MCC3463383.1 exodeoxyribonuclease III [Microcoleus sp. PH2017_11_PCY_U_A]MCC3481764.1 exodeoxyribonuclease III [Microcoleus sp. PH2017_12_PCY_D_A]MCC3529313.1 exodeoxyribonuclease III [Microcoleus sp. PH2017_21_RUC_O_A]
MKIATWNVNSIRTRLEHVINWLQTNQIDVLCLQETKVTDKDFPLEPFLDIGYNCYISGQKSYNGVAIFSRSPMSQISAGFSPILGTATAGSFDEQKRLIAGVIDDICIISVYVPNGSEVGSEKYQYKLHWLKLLQEYLKIALDKSPNLCICGDFNIVPDDRDIYNPKAAANSVGLSIPERQALTEITELGLSDPFRKFTSEGGHYSWWDYRAAAFPRNNGWRIDHHYLSQTLYDRAKNCTIDIEPRKLVKPSDHTPVIVEI